MMFVISPLTFLCGKICGQIGFHTPLPPACTAPTHLQLEYYTNRTTSVSHNGQRDFPFLASQLTILIQARAVLKNISERKLKVCLLLCRPDFLLARLQVFSCQYPLCMILSWLFPGVEIQPFSEVTHDIPRTRHVSHRLVLPTLLCGCVWNNKSAI